MTDQEAFELLVKYSGGEVGLSKIKAMILLVGVDKTVSNIIGVGKNKHKKGWNDEFSNWIKQSVLYLEQKMETEN